MLEVLNSIDCDLIVFLNSFHNLFFDNFMWLVSKTFSWVVMLIVLLYVIFKKDWKQAVIVAIAIALVIVFADQISSTVIKHAVERFRPTHNPLIADSLHIVNGYRGGNYGFVSSHAANSFGVALFVSLLFRYRWLSLAMFSWAAVLSYSRIYLGVHYPGDIIGGAIVGCVGALLVYAAYFYAVKYYQRHFYRLVESYSVRQSILVACAVPLNFSIIVVAAAFLCCVA